MLSLAEHIKQEGVDQGVQQGIEQGMNKGIQRGVEQGKRDLLIAMLQKGKSPREVAHLTDQPLTIVESLRQLIQNTQKETVK